MKNKQIFVWLTLECYVLLCAACVWAWQKSEFLLFFGLALATAFVLQMLIRQGGKEWRWMFGVHAALILLVIGVGGLLALTGENWEPVLGGLFALAGFSAAMGCIFEWIFYRKFSRKDEDDATEV